MTIGCVLSLLEASSVYFPFLKEDALGLIPVCSDLGVW